MTSDRLHVDTFEAVGAVAGAVLGAVVGAVVGAVAGAVAVVEVGAF